MQTIIKTRQPEEQTLTNLLRQCIDWKRMFLLLLLSCWFPAMSFAEVLPFKSGEQLNYEISYKYGIVMLKAGTAQYNVSDRKYNDKDVFKTTLEFKTSSFFDKVYRVRDTLYSYLNMDARPVFHERTINEGNTKYKEQVFFQKQSKSLTEVRVRRENIHGVKFDTIMKTESMGYDMLNIFVFARTLDYSKLQVDDAFPLVIFVGKDLVKMKIRYKGQSVLEKSETLKYKAVRFEVDIVDEAFNGEKNAMEIWISDDDNRVPLKLKAKLRIGAAEATLSSYKNLKYPLSSEIVIKSQ